MLSIVNSFNQPLSGFIILAAVLCGLGALWGIMWGWTKYISQQTRKLIYWHICKNSLVTIILVGLFGNNILAMLLGLFLYYGGANIISLVYQPTIHTRFYIRHLQFSYGWLCSLIACVGMNVWVKKKTFSSSFHVDVASTTLFPSLDFVVCFDAYNAVFLLVTACIGFIVSWYAQEYIKHEPQQLAFLRLLHAFIFSMLLLLLSGSVWVLLLGWELIGITSFFLISFYTTNIRSFRAGFKAFLVNKISDVGIYCFCLSTYFNQILVFTNTTTHTYWDTFHLYASTSTTLTTTQQFVLTSVVLACLCKSAQIGFHVWLPDSMEAPVPASALIHSATLVSAGIFLLGRFLPLLQLHPWLFSFVVGVGALTSIYGALIACYQTDVKKILAYSTISHCGILLVLLCCAPQSIFFLYFAAHGIFKALSFVFVGRILQSTFTRQDMRSFGGLHRAQIGLVGILGCGVYALGGAPFFFGFLNKTLYLEYLFVLPSGYALWVVCSIGCGVLGIIYATRLFYFSGLARPTLLTNKGRYMIWLCQTYFIFYRHGKLWQWRWWLLFGSILSSAGFVFGLYYGFSAFEFITWTTPNSLQPSFSIYKTLSTSIIQACFLGCFGGIIGGLFYIFNPQMRRILPFFLGIYIFLIYIFIFFF